MCQDSENITQQLGRVSMFSRLPLMQLQNGLRYYRLESTDVTDRQHNIQAVTSNCVKRHTVAIEYVWTD